MVSAAFARKPPKNVIQIFVLVRFGAMCGAGFAGNAVAGPKPYLFERIHTQRFDIGGEEKWFENCLREPARPCCFPVLRTRLLRSTRLSSTVSTAFECKPLKPPKNVVQIFVLVRFGAMCGAGFAGNTVQNHGFVCRETNKSWNETLGFAGNAVQNYGFVCGEIKSWNEILSFLEDSDASF